MKYLLFSLCFFITFNLYGQRKKKAKPIKLFKIQGGFLYDASPESNYAGFGTFTLGWARYKNKGLEGFDLALIGFESEKVLKVINSPSWVLRRGWIRENKSIELSYYRSINLTGNIENGFFVGPSASFGYHFNRASPMDSSEDPISNKWYGMGLGIRADYILKLKKNIFLVASTKLTVLDFKYNTYCLENPNLVRSQSCTNDFKVDFLRNQYPLMVGIGFKL